MVFRSEEHLHKFERAKRRRLKTLWLNGFERVEIPSTEIGKNQQLKDFSKLVTCPYCKKEGGKFNSRATEYSVFYKCLFCEKYFEAMG